MLPKGITRNDKFLMNTDPKILTRRPNPETDKRTSQTSEISQECKIGLTFKNQYNSHYNRINGKTQMQSSQ